jgi:predicted lipoprotein with Yx(FWY)xxD motif
MKSSHLIVSGLAAALVLAVGLTGAFAASQSADRTLTVGTANSSLGRILVDARGRTLYLFEKDRRGHSACSGYCATYWPPLLTRGTPIAGRSVKGSLLGVARRADGTRQVTYAGHPLYRYAGDSRSGQTTGQELQDFGAGWYVVSPAGKKVERDG